jgi:serine/threonine-protein kinase HipA
VSQRQLNVFLNGLQIGALFEDNDVWQFTYEASWADSGFDLSPSLPRAELRHRDGSSSRPVQWYFDNLLPEERLREVLTREANLRGADAFALLEYLGAESAGSLVLLPPGCAEVDVGDRRTLSNEALSERIRNLPRASLTLAAPKRMSLAGAQHKLLAIYENDALYEPVGGTPSTHILKPNHPEEAYSSSVANEYFTMSVARAVGLQVPIVHRMYVPEPVYIVERFDRTHTSDGTVVRRHIIDSCQLLNQSFTFKYRSATLVTLKQLIEACRSTVTTRLRVFQWLVFNLLVGNADNHLKNLSYYVGQEGIELAPFYDLLSTAVYTTKAMADARATWDNPEMVIHLPGAKTFGQITRSAVIDAADELGIPAGPAANILDRLLREVPVAMDKLYALLETEHVPAGAERFVAGELRLLRSIRHVITADMVKKLAQQ